MTDRNCRVCFGLGWVCENHPEEPWDKDLGCACGAGIPCECNDSDPPDTSEMIVEENATLH
jgi:hypothetical protein